MAQPGSAPPAVRAIAALHDRFVAAVTPTACRAGASDSPARAADAAVAAGACIRRLMFAFFLQRNGCFGDESHLERNLAGSRQAGPDRFYAGFLSRRFADAPPGVDWPDGVFGDALETFAGFRWNLGDEPDGGDDEVTPDALGHVLERQVNQKESGAYFTRPEITASLCDRVIHRLIVDAVNATGRDFADLPQLLAGLDDGLAADLLDRVLPSLRLLDPACGAGAFLLAALATLVACYRAVLAWVERHGAAPLRARRDRIRGRHASVDHGVKRRVLTDNLFGVDLMPAAVETTRLRLLLSLAASGDAGDPPPDLALNLRVGNSLLGRLDTGDGDELDRRLLAEFHDLRIPFEQPTWVDDQPGPPARRPVTADDVARLRPLHWGSAFGPVMAAGGFDAVLTNPPWDVFKPNGKEFFQRYDPAVTRKAMTAAAFDRARRAVLRSPAVRAEWLDYLATFPHQSGYFRSAPAYAHQTAVAGGRRVGSDPNLYKLFLERSFRLLRPGGRCGIVLPGGVCTDLGAKGVREMLFDHATVESLFCLTNGRGVFGDVHRSFKMAVLSFARGGRTTTFPAAFMRQDVAELARFPAEGGLPVDVAAVRRLSPNSLSIPEFKHRLDVEIAGAAMRFPPLGETMPGAWDLKLVREFDMTNDRRLFEPTPRPGAVPLFEGKMIGPFDGGHAPPRFWVDADRGRAALAGRSGGDGYRLGYRSVGENTNARNFIAAVLPPGVFCGNSLILSKGAVPPAVLCLLAGLFNSFVLDYLLRLRIARNLNMFFVYQLPVPRLTAADPAFGAIVTRSARLTCTSPAFDGLAAAVGLSGPGATDPADRTRLRAELDGIVAHVYGLTEPQFAHVLSTFPAVDPAVRAETMVVYRRLGDTGGAAPQPF